MCRGIILPGPCRPEDFEQFLEKEKLRGMLGTPPPSNDEGQSESHKQILFIADEDGQYIEQVRANFSALFHVIAATNVNAAMNLVAEQATGSPLCCSAIAFPKTAPLRCWS